MLPEDGIELAALRQFACVRTNGQLPAWTTGSPRLTRTLPILSRKLSEGAKALAQTSARRFGPSWGKQGTLPAAAGHGQAGVLRSELRAVPGYRVVTRAGDDAVYGGIPAADGAVKRRRDEHRRLLAIFADEKVSRGVPTMPVGVP